MNSPKKPSPAMKSALLKLARLPLKKRQRLMKIEALRREPPKKD